MNYNYMHNTILFRLIACHGNVVLKRFLQLPFLISRSRRTQAETMKLKRIQKELQALDDMVSADIGILRNRIDQASLEYSYAR